MVAGVLYGAGIVALLRRGIRWPALPTLGFYLLGLGSYAWISFGFLGAYSAELRWAFTTRIALLLFVVPGLISLGTPVALARAALTGRSLRGVDRFLASRLGRFMGNAIFEPFFALSAFLVFLTPLAAAVRDNTYAEWGITLLIPFVGILMVLPIIERTTQHTSFFITVEFLLAFVALVIDAIPGILLRLNETVLDHAPAVVGSLPTWFPNALHDQHLSGDFLWFIAEIADVPVLIILFIRWSRIDRHEAKSMDDLSDEEMDALTQAHLRDGQRH